MQLSFSLLEASNLNMGQGMPLFFFKSKGQRKRRNYLQTLGQETHKLIEVDVMAVPWKREEVETIKGLKLWC